jgi:hypothetical protein
MRGQVLLEVGSDSIMGRLNFLHCSGGRVNKDVAIVLMILIGEISWIFKKIGEVNGGGWVILYLMKEKSSTRPISSHLWVNWAVR